MTVSSRQTFQTSKPWLGLKFLSELRRDLPRTDDSPRFYAPLATRMKPEELLQRLEKIAHGFQKWAADGFSPVSQAAAASKWQATYAVKGHLFGLTLSAGDKTSLIAFLKTL